MKKLAILGSAESIFKPDYDDKDLEIWAVGTCFNNSPQVNNIKRIDRSIDIHHVAGILDNYNRRGTNYNKHGDIPIWVQERFINHPVITERINNPVPYPLEEVKKYIDYTEERPKSFCSSFDYLVVMASMMGYKEIYLYKILLTLGQEYYFENPSNSWWIEYLTKKEGINFHIAEDSNLFKKDYFYGYDKPLNVYRFLTKKKCLLSDVRRHYGFVVEHLSRYNYNFGMLNGVQLIREVNKGRKTEEEANKILLKAQETAEEHLPKIKDQEDAFFHALGAVQGIEFLESDIR